jgi:2-amino-4-hydroxy-6-hydroxymethyldihydropteridine diphosphokinase
MEEILKIEASMGREREQVFGPRNIDIDILFYDNLSIDSTNYTPNLIIPHPLLHNRKFVLLPLSEIAPNFVHPIINKKISEILDGLVSEEKCYVFMLAQELLAQELLAQELLAQELKGLIDTPQVL